MKKEAKTVAYWRACCGKSYTHIDKSFLVLFCKKELLALLLLLPSAATAQISAAQAHIKHVIFIMQENRSFDSYFGTFPNAHGLNLQTCVPLNPAAAGAGCIKPYHDPLEINNGGPHADTDALADLDNGVTKALMDGFVLQQTNADKTCPLSLAYCVQSYIGTARHDVMGYHTAEDIPNYWAYAKNFVLQDMFFQSVRSSSLPNHLEMTSEWVALCSNPKMALSCVTQSSLPAPTATTSYPWANLFQLMDLHGVSWKYYVATGSQPDCDDDSLSCVAKPQSASMPSLWNVPGLFGYVQNKGAAYLQTHDPPLPQLFTDIGAGTLPQVSWIVPDAISSEHPPSSTTLGMEYVTGIVDAVMQSPYWADTAIFISWDDWGGFYDHVLPPNVDSDASITPVEGYGLRVPGLMISPYARAGLIDSNVMSFDSYAVLIEELFLKAAHLVPSTLGNPDHRPDIRDEIKSVRFLNGQTAAVGSLLAEFDFTQAPLPALVLPLDIPYLLVANCNASPASNLQCTTPTVTLTWAGLTSAQGTPPFTYYVVRDTPPVSVCVTTATSCTDTPGAGNHVYRAFTVDGHKVASPVSAGTEADEP